MLIETKRMDFFFLVLYFFYVESSLMHADIIFNLFLRSSKIHFFLLFHTRIYKHQIMRTLIIS